MKKFTITLLFALFALISSACQRIPGSALNLEPGSSGGATGNLPSLGPSQFTLSPLPMGLTACPDSFITTTNTLINNVRAQYGAAPLALEEKLMEAARQRVVSMATNHNFSHAGWDSTIYGTGYPVAAMAENIGLDGMTAEAMVNGWVHSPGHFANLVNPLYTQTGIGCAVDMNGEMWWAQDFGLPVAAPSPTPGNSPNP